MGEMLLGHLREDLPLVIIRPSIITSIYKEPLPGWMEGTRSIQASAPIFKNFITENNYLNLGRRFCRTIDSLIIGYAKGKLTCFLGDPNSTMDVVSN